MRLGAPGDPDSRTIFEHALERALMAGHTRHVVAVVPQSHHDEATSLASRVSTALSAQFAAGGLHTPDVEGGPSVPDVRVVVGGARRSDSVAAGLAALDPDLTTVLVHDAARCLAPPSLFDRVAEAVSAGAPAVVPGVVVTDTIKVIDDRARVVDTPDRGQLRAIQTPQGFTRTTLVRAHENGGDASDDAAMVERLGEPVTVIEGDDHAFKVTTPPDLDRAARILGM